MAAFDDDDDFVVVGTALEPFEDDAVIRKKPIAIQDQIVTDDQGRRRFHGAFTGGFSAGYYNSVGSKEGWAPTSFKSTRSDRPSFKNQNAQDFMDDEDKSAFGIAPQLLRPTEDFSSNRRESLKRPRPTSEGPIPGLPVLQQIIQPVVESVGVKVLRKMGWSPGQGVGPKTYKKTRKKKVMKEDNSNKDKPAEVIHESVKVYSCLLPPSFLRSDEDDTNSYSSSGDENLRPLLVRPQDVDSPLCNPKENIFGLGYKGLDRNTVLSGHVDIFGPALKFKVDNKKMNITGEAFGIGVFEDDDEEVYSRDDMTQYDFALETPAERKRRLQQEGRNKRKNKDTNDGLIPGFITNKSPSTPSQFFPPPQLPSDFQPIHAQKKSRFGNFFMVSLDQENSLQINKKLGLDRHQLTREERYILLESDEDRRVLPAIEVPPASQPSQSSAPKISFTIGSTKSPALNANSSNKVESKLEGSSEKSTIDRIERLKKFTEVLQAYSSEKPKTDNTAFKPFLKHPGKQERYDKYLTLKTAGYAECLRDLQPQEMTDWECEREKLEFERASSLYQPMSGEMSSRFVSAKSHDISHIVPQREEEKEKDPTQDPKVAARMNLFGKLTHKVVEWHPDRIVCKRFNVPPPYPDSKTVGSRITSSKIGTSGLQGEELKESISKKSLFDDLDFSKPPPGLLPSVSQLTFSPITGLPTPTDTAATPTSSQQHHQLDFRPTSTSTSKAPTNSANIAAIIEIPVEDSNSVSSLRTTTTKPPLDLFKEIFADSSESEEEENDDGNDREKHSSSSMTTTTVNQGDDHEGKGAPKQREVLENSRKRDDKSVVSKELQSKRVEKRLPEEKSPRHEENRGIFHNLDFSKLTSPTSSAYTPSNPTIQPKQTSEGRNVNKLKDSVPQQSQNQLLTSSKMQVDEDVLKEEFFYGPALPASANGKKIMSESVLSQTQLHKLVGTSSSHLDSEYSSRSHAVPSVSSLRSVDKGEDTIWIEKDTGESSSKRRKKHSKKSKTKTKKMKRSRSRSRSDHHGRHSSKSKKSKRHKSSSSSKHKSFSKKHKRTKTGKSQRSKSGHRDKSESSYSSSSDTETDSCDSHGRRSESKSSDEARFPPVSIQYSQNSKALIAKLKEMI